MASEKHEYVVLIWRSYTKFYHALTKQRRVRNKIVGFHDEMGNWITEENGVEKVPVDYFDGLFRTTDPTEFDSFFGGNSSFYLSPNESTIIEGSNGGRGPTSFIYDALGESTGTGWDDNSFLSTFLACY